MTFVEHSEAISSIPDDVDPNDCSVYERLAEKGALQVLWGFIQLRPDYRAAWNTYSHSSQTPEARTAARHFGLHGLICPAKATLDIGDHARPRLDCRESDGKFWISFDLGEEVVPQLRAAQWMLARKTTSFTRTVPAVHSYTNHRLAFLLRALHLHMNSCEPSAAAAILAEMKHAWADRLRRTGRPEKGGSYTIRRMRADIEAAIKIRDELALTLMHEARMSRYAFGNPVSRRTSPRSQKRDFCCCFSEMQVVC